MNLEYKMITDANDFFELGCGRCKRFSTSGCSTKLWDNGLRQLRRICSHVGLSEHVKWGHPCYMHAGRNIAIIGAFQENFRLSFFNAGLMTDPKGLLERQGPNTQHPDMLCFYDNADVIRIEEAIQQYLREAMGYAEARIKPPREQRDLELPDELVEAMDGDPELAEAFHALTPGRQRSYIINLAGAKNRETRINRITKFRTKIIDGRGANER